MPKLCLGSCKRQSALVGNYTAGQKKKIFVRVSQVSGSVNSKEKILKPNDYPGNLDHPTGDWKTIFRKSKSLICGF